MRPYKFGGSGGRFRLLFSAIRGVSFSGFLAGPPFVAGCCIDLWFVSVSRSGLPIGFSRVVVTACRSGASSVLFQGLITPDFYFDGSRLCWFWLLFKIR